MPRPLAALAAALVLAPALAGAHPHGRFVLHAAEEGAEGAVRLDTHTGAVAVMGAGEDGEAGWVPVRLASGSWKPKSYMGPSYALEGMPLEVGATFLVDTQGGRTWVVREDETGLVLVEVD